MRSRSVGVDRIPPFVNFHRHEHAAATSRLGKRQVFVERLDDRLGNQNMQPALDGFERDAEMRIVGRKYRDDVARFQLVHRTQIGLRVAGDIVVRKTSEADVEILVNAGNDIVQMPPDAGKLVAIRAGHHEPANFAAAAHVEQRESNDAGALVGAACSVMNIAGRIFAGTDH